MVSADSLSPILLLPMIAILGIATGIEDLRRGRISNRWVAFAILYAIIAHIIIGDAGFRFAINAAAALAAGVLLWASDLWKAGDAKLFLAYALLIPLGTYQHGHIEHFPSVVILVNTFIPLFAFFSLKNIAFSGWKDKKKAIHDTIRIMPTAVIALFFITWIFAIIGPVLPIGWAILAALFYVAIGRWIKQRHLLLIAVLRLAFDYSIYTFDFMLGLVGSAILVFAFVFLSRLSKDARLPFAFFLFIGVIVTLVFRGSFFSVLIGLIS